MKSSYQNSFRLPLQFDLMKNKENKRKTLSIRMEYSLFHIIKEDAKINERLAGAHIRWILKQHYLNKRLKGAK